MRRSHRPLEAGAIPSLALSGPLAEVAARLAAPGEGLTTAEAARRLAVVGPNDLTDRQPSWPMREVAAFLRIPSRSSC